MLGMVGFYAAFTAAPLVAEDLTGTQTRSGLPGAGVILGTACGAAALSMAMRRHGRRSGLTLGWLLGAAGAVAAIAAITVGAFVKSGRPDRAGDRTHGPGVGSPGRLNRRTVVAIAAFVTAQFVMSLIMTITPVHVRGHDHGLTGVGVVISLHVLGMFGFAPVAGWACDRFGALRVALTLALFVLGLGWTFEAVASLTSGLLLAQLGSAVLCLVGIVLAATAAGIVLVAIRTDPEPATV